MPVNENGASTKCVARAGCYKLYIIGRIDKLKINYLFLYCYWIELFITMLKLASFNTMKLFWMVFYMKLTYLSLKFRILVKSFRILEWNFNDLIQNWSINHPWKFRPNPSNFYFCSNFIKNEGFSLCFFSIFIKKLKLLGF